MGLRAAFTMDDLGYAEETEQMGISIDYSAGCDAFVDTFLSVAQDLCPVDTGYLLSTIDGYSSDDGCECVADADYAQYVEYGTCYMSDQPYFEPAIEAALDEAIPLWDAAVDMAMEEEEELLMELEEAEAEKRSGGQKGGFFGSLLGAIVAIILFAPLILIGEILKDASGGYSHGGSGHGGHSVGGDLKGGFLNIDIEIT